MSSIGVSNMEELIGNQEFLSARNIDLPKTSIIDLSSLVNEHSTPDRSWLKHLTTAHSNGSVLEEEFLSDTKFIDSIKNHEILTKEIEIKNTDRSVCAKISGEIAELHGNTGFNGELNLNFTGYAGQSFGAFLLKGMNVQLIGEANDYVCKGMNGGILTILSLIHI